MSSFDFFTVGINSMLFPWPVHVHSVQEISPNFLRRRTRLDGKADNTDNSQSQAASDDRLLSHVTQAASNAVGTQLAHR